MDFINARNSETQSQTGDLFYQMTDILRSEFYIKEQR